jgi:preprotein translocase subunit SecB
MLAPLQLDDVVVESLLVRTNTDELPDPVSADQTPVPDVSLDILRVENELKFLIPFLVRINHRKADFRRYGYSVELKVLGFFSFPDKFEEHEAGHMIHTNGPAILYGVARGIIVQTLALTIAGKVILPSVNFVEIMRRRDHRLHRRRMLNATLKEDDSPVSSPAKS